MKLLILLAIISSTLAITFKCNYFIRNYWNLPLLYSCNVTSIFNTNNSNLTIKGTHLPAKSNADVEGLEINLNRTNLDYFPTGIDKFFPKLRAIYFYYGKISKLSGDELVGLKNLEWFSSSYNSIEILPGNLFRDNKEMRIIFFYANNIYNVSSNLLDGLSKLEYVNMGKNFCINRYADNAFGIFFLKDELKARCMPMEVISTTQKNAESDVNQNYDDKN